MAWLVAGRCVIGVAPLDVVHRRRAGPSWHLGTTCRYPTLDGQTVQPGCTITICLALGIVLQLAGSAMRTVHRPGQRLGEERATAQDDAG